MDASAGEEESKDSAVEGYSSSEEQSSSSSHAHDRSQSDDVAVEDALANTQSDAVEESMVPASLPCSHVRDPAVRRQAVSVIATTLNEVRPLLACELARRLSADVGAEAEERSTELESIQGTVAEGTITAATALEEAINSMTRSGYRARVRDLVSALRRTPRARNDAQQLLSDLIAGNPVAAAHFAALRAEALLSPAELTDRHAAAVAAMRAATVRLEDEGLPMAAREELTCSACGMDKPVLQLVGYCRELENILHGTHGGVGAQRFAARCNHCLHSWFHMEGSTEHHD